MIRSILLALDDTEGSLAAAEMALSLARQHGAALSVALVLDHPHTSDSLEAVPPGGGAFLERRNRALAKRVAEDAEAALQRFLPSAGQTPFTVLRLPQAPEEALLAASRLHDLVVLGRDATLGMEEIDDDLPPIASSFLQRGARPLLLVPPGAALRAEARVMVGYDASVPVQRSLASYVHLGLAAGQGATVLAVAGEAEAAGAMAEEGAAFLRQHGVEAEAQGLVGDRPIDLLLAEVAVLKPRLLVAGAFEENGLRALLLGSGTRKLLAQVTCPVFIQH